MIQFDIPSHSLPATSAAMTQRTLVGLGVA